MEKTFSGSGISHRVNGIATQKAITGFLPYVNKVKIEKFKKHFIEVPMNKIYVYKAGCKFDAPQST